MRVSASLSPIDFSGPFEEYRRFCEQRMEAAVMIATDKATTSAKQRIRSGMQGAGLGRLGNAIDSTSDLKRGRGVHRYANGFSASGLIFARSASERTLGALVSYTLGADILPVRGRYLWIATDQIPKFVGRYRMTPELYKKGGFEQKIGKLMPVKSINGRPLLIVRHVGVGALGQPRSARSLLKTGRPRKGQRSKEFLVAFYAIPRTSREARIDIREIVQSEISGLPDRFFAALGRI